MAGIMGLISGQEFSDNSFHSFNNRRQTFWNYPEGGAPLMGLLSLMDTEETDTFLNFGWEEIRYAFPKTIAATSSGGGAGAISATSGGASITSATTLVANTTYYLGVADNSDFRVNDTFIIIDVALSPSGIGNIHGVVTSVGVTGEIAFRALVGVVFLNTAAGIVGKNIGKLGTAYGEGSKSGQGRMLVPVEPQNNCQIFKDSMEFTGTALKIPTDFDKTGAYKTKSKTAALDHMVGLEYQFLFGSKSNFSSALAAGGSFGGSVTPTRTTGGVIHFLEQWEATNGGTAVYRPNSAALTADTQDDKRIITNSTGAMTKAKWDEYNERVFRKANTQSYEKLVFCGNGAARAVNQLIERKIVRELQATERGDTFRMRMKSVETSWGILHFKTHPLLTEQPGHFYSMLIIDVPFLKYRPLNDRDTIKLDNRQDNDEDGRKDIWLTEAGLELRFPEAHMLLKNVQSIT